MAGPLHFHMVTDPSFPLPAAGVVHLRNRIEQRAPLASDAALAFECALKPAVRTHRGLEIDLETIARQDNAEVWRSTITFLSRSGGKSAPESARRGATAASSAADVGGVVTRSVVWRVPEDTGRRYARIAGDFNPIHQHAVAARLFGFKRAIVHGMYTLARAAAECADDLPGAPFTLDCNFRRPVYLPSTVLFEARRPPQGDAALTFEVRSGDTRCVEGRASVGV
jgi:acyl dehydratase